VKTDQGRDPDPSSDADPYSDTDPDPATQMNRYRTDSFRIGWVVMHTRTYFHKWTMTQLWRKYVHKIG
jgi:hypothetical protein